MPMQIFVDVEEAAERLEELIALASRQDEVYVCRGRWPIARLTSWSEKNDDFPSEEVAKTPAVTGPTACGSKLIEGGTIDEVWSLAARGKPKQDHKVTSAHDDLFDEDGLPR
ncbi:hypothetical protein [Sinorhizobium americanum]|uniref:Prevent-host-death family protein n=1 Tax=Sinorhizobium americanum TaxID=194963 RepID=A0A1L3LUT3_9HYPH|nr:hypothetical protein [Sinorhizobium americanum]APG87336.1 hypothetical protein SAMCCGM7_pC0131 [Sinorhizobium americanum CCGM7]APG93857.1 hypothetical protein SAMCFNEI73_pC0133 [Sinorhizobium americanum]OAP40345.1 hypothetical protein ATC00_20860 [Sinorhizobium americanum]TCN34072.1 hypothetical protein EV184_102383 [Sinorhizobium americanum]